MIKHPYKILIMGLPGAGKTWLAKRLKKDLNCAHYNADSIREDANDWDFSEEGRYRQALRMKNIADFEKSQGRTVICDFVCPTNELRYIFNPDVLVFVDTVKEGRFEDTNRLFERPNPSSVDFRVETKAADVNADAIVKYITMMEKDRVWPKQ